jgi:hypothetical protein
MKKVAMYLLTFALFILFAGHVYAQASKDLRNDNSNATAALEKSVKDYLRHERFDSDTPVKNKFSIIKLFKSKAFAAPENIDADRKKIREEWKELLGLDVFYPYFKAQEIENYVQKKSTVKVFNMKGKPEFSRESNEIKYIFKSKF